MDETARQSAELVDGITNALQILASGSENPEAARQQATSMIVSTLQGQDRIEQRCKNLAHAARHFAMLPARNDDSDYEDVWSQLTLDELRLAELSGAAAQEGHGEPDLF
ncbi:hypothetical protein [Devosia pacifica]|uniref:hypothetical protein n=1 Tax=Devosia pacifica TaxID=1335967 RepID=UPI001679D71C|nr:hypothetical protein [Devosia pacifica]